VLSIYSLAPLNAILNTTAAILLLAGFYFVKHQRIRAHRVCMIAAICTSAAFLTSYLIFHYEVGDILFTGRGWIRPIYFLILIPHVILAGLIVPLVLITLYFALRARFMSHRRIARWTWPLWIYVSVTGVIVYLMLYQLYTPYLPPIR
jgi:putative membrane protein